MMPQKHVILGVHITDRIKKVSKVQEVLTEWLLHKNPTGIARNGR